MLVYLFVLIAEYSCDPGERFHPHSYSRKSSLDHVDYHRKGNILNHELAGRPKLSYNGSDHTEMFLKARQFLESIDFNHTQSLFSKYTPSWYSSAYDKLLTNANSEKGFTEAINYFQTINPSLEDITATSGKLMKNLLESLETYYGQNKMPSLIERPKPRNYSITSPFSNLDLQLVTPITLNNLMYYTQTMLDKDRLSDSNLLRDKNINLPLSMSNYMNDKLRVISLYQPDQDILIPNKKYDAEEEMDTFAKGTLIRDDNGNAIVNSSTTKVFNSYKYDKIYDQSILQNTTSLNNIWKERNLFTSKNINSYSMELPNVKTHRPMITSIELEDYAKVKDGNEIGENNKILKHYHYENLLPTTLDKLKLDHLTSRKYRPYEFETNLADSFPRTVGVNKPTIGPVNLLNIAKKQKKIHKLLDDYVYSSNLTAETYTPLNFEKNIVESITLRFAEDHHYSTLWYNLTTHHRNSLSVTLENRALINSFATSPLYYSLEKDFKHSIHRKFRINSSDDQIKKISSNIIRQNDGSLLTTGDSHKQLSFLDASTKMYRHSIKSWLDKPGDHYKMAANNATPRAIDQYKNAPHEHSTTEDNEFKDPLLYDDKFRDYRKGLTTVSGQLNEGEMRGRSENRKSTPHEMDNRILNLYQTNVSLIPTTARDVKLGEDSRKWGKTEMNNEETLSPKEYDNPSGNNDTGDTTYMWRNSSNNTVNDYSITAKFYKVETEKYEDYKKPSGHIAKEELLLKKYGSILSVTDRVEDGLFEAPKLAENCWAERLKTEPFSFVPNCNPDGTYSGKQCHRHK
ncbi:unnamed protein product [Gordionus sp. m RMFG-2023]